MEKEKISQIRSFIAEGRIEKALEQLIEHAPDKIKNEVILISSSFKSLKQKEIIGAISNEQSSLMKTQILSATLALLKIIAIEPERFKLESRPISSEGNRTSFIITLRGDFKEFTEGDKLEIVEILRRITRDESLSIKQIKEGSIKLHIEADEESFIKLLKLFKENNLSHLINQEVENIEIAMESKRKTPYDVGLSFAGEDRHYVSQVADFLRQEGIKVFYDEFEQVNLWGKDLYQYLCDIYKNKCKYTIIFISKAYAEKRWTKHELKSSQTRAFKENIEYILPVRFDDTNLPGLNETIGYLNGNDISPKKLAQFTIAKVNE